MKANTIIALIAMTILGLTENGIVKAICFGVLFINFFNFVKIFEGELC